MQNSQINIGFLGLGTVGTGAAGILEDNLEIPQRLGVKLRVKTAAVKDLEEERGRNFPKIALTTDAMDVIADPEIDIVVEVMGGIHPAKEFIETALRNGKYVVTANKDLMAQYGTELLQLAAEHQRNIFYEASVGGGIPIIRPLKQCLVANRISKITAIINGTTNFILTKMSQDQKEFPEALAEAQSLGFAEQDPSSDIEGKDAAYKLTILASLAFQARVNPEQVFTESMSQITLNDVEYARELGFVIKLLAIAEDTRKGISLRVQPTLVDMHHPLAAINDEFNAVFIEGDAIGEAMFYGPGAGSKPTGSAIVADVAYIVRHMQGGCSNEIVETSFTEKPFLSVGEQRSRFYLRIETIDQPGVFASVATAFGDEQVSLDMIMQKSSLDRVAEIVLVTHEITEAQFRQAIRNLLSLASIKRVCNVIRVMERRDEQ